MTPVFLKVSVWAISALAALTFLWDVSKPSDSQRPIVGQITTVLNSVVPTIPSTTTTVVKGCAAYVADAITVGWSASEAPTIARVIMRESGCNPLAFNREDSNGGSRGLFQINGIWCNKSKAWPNGWLQEKGVISTCDDLFEPQKNIVSALYIWQHSKGWSPWNLPMLP
jgi:hypothetical protein